MRDWGEKIKKSSGLFGLFFYNVKKDFQVKYVIANAILEIYIRKKLINDERDILIDLKSYKLGYIYMKLVYSHLQELFCQWRYLIVKFTKIMGD